MQCDFTGSQPKHKPHTVSLKILSGQVRDEEMDELDRHMMDSCQFRVTGSESTEGKVNILLQTYISKQLVENFSLVSDMSYVAQVRGYRSL